jgi:hypothetical protein
MEEVRPAGPPIVAIDVAAAAMVCGEVDVSLFEVLVRLAVAIVVDEVAHLLNTFSGGRVAHRVSVRVVGVAHPYAGAPAESLTGKAHRAQSLKSIVWRAIAVLIQAVAQLFLRLPKGAAMDPSLIAGGHSDGADARFARRAIYASPRVAVVVNTIAVVVKPIADLAHGQHLTLARAEDAATAILRTGSAPTIAQLSLVAVVTGPRQRLPLCVLVDVPIAVVIGPIADLGPGLLKLDARHISVTARRDTRGAHSVRAGRAVLVAPRVAVVYLAIAVVVRTIAELGPWAHLSHAGSIVTRSTRLPTTRAIPHVRGALRAVVAGPHNGIAVFVLVHHGITVVVDSIADLRDGVLHRHTDSALVGARRLPARTDPGLPGGADLATGGVPLVRLSVAVIVLAVAELLKGNYLTLAAFPESICAGSHPAHAAPDPFGSLLALIAGEGQRLALLVFIEVPITVVVDAVTDLVAGLFQACADELTVLVAARLALAADTRALGDTRHPCAHVSLVKFTVAIVVHAVALLWERQDLVAAFSPLGVFTHTVSRLAGADPLGLRIPTVARVPQRLSVVTLVRESITVIVGTVARLHRGKPSLLAHGLSGDAPNNPWGTGAGDPSVTLDVCVDGVLISEAVAIIVDAVADLIHTAIAFGVLVVAVRAETPWANPISVVVVVVAEVRRYADLRHLIAVAHIDAVKPIRTVPRMGAPERTKPFLELRGEIQAEDRRALGVVGAKFSGRQAIVRVLECVGRTHIGRRLAGNIVAAPARVFWRHFERATGLRVRARRQRGDEKKGGPQSHGSTLTFP